jgi:hypothetical protein
MIELTPVNLPENCANLTCPNKVGEGAFKLLETEGDAVGGHRPIRLWMCQPCAAAMMHGETTSAADNWAPTPTPTVLQNLDSLLKVGEKIGVDYRWEGSVRRDYGKIITVQSDEFTIEASTSGLKTIAKDDVLRVWPVFPPDPDYVREHDEDWRIRGYCPTKYHDTVYAPPTSIRHAHDIDASGNCRHPDCDYYSDHEMNADEVWRHGPRQ